MNGSSARQVPNFWLYVSLLLGSCVAYASGPGTFDRTLSISGPVDLDVVSDRGGMTIVSGTANIVRVRGIVKPLFGRFDLQISDANVRAILDNPPVEQIGNHIRIGYVADPKMLSGLSIRFEVETPRNTQLRAHSTSGGISVNGIEGPIQTETSSGRSSLSNIRGDMKITSRSGGVIARNVGPISVRNESGGIQILSVQGSVESVTTSGHTDISDVSGDVRSATRSGGIEIDDVKGSVVLNNTSGSIDAFRLAGSVNAATTSGAIRISQVNAAPIRALARSGAITVELAGGSGYLIDAQSDSGKISSTIASNLGGVSNRRRLKTQVGPGGPLVDIDTRSSNISIN